MDLLRRPRPARPQSNAGWARLSLKTGTTWCDLLEEDAPDGVRVLHAMLDGGLLEAWQDVHGHVRLKPGPVRRIGSSSPQ